MKKQQGFTLIELIMVIVILGILSAFALPRFADLGSEAREAALQGAYGAIKSAAAIAHSKSLASGAGANVTISLEGSSITMANKYPTADAAGILAAAQITSDDFDTSGSAPLVISPKGVNSDTNCRIEYTAAGSPGDTPTISIDPDTCD